METEFDPYRKWLGIAPKDQPPHHYRLLGIDLYEEDADVIGHAADQRMAHLRTFRTGRYVQLSQRILNEVSAAKLTLLNRDKKRAYDAQLRQELAVTPPPPPADPTRQLPPRPGTPPAVATAPRFHEAPPAVTMPSPRGSTGDGAPVVGVSRATPSAARRIRRQRKNMTPVMVSIVLVILIALIAVVAIAIWSSGEATSSTQARSKDHLAINAGSNMR